MIDLRVCFLGDSFTLGTGDDDGLGWVGRVHATERGRGIDLTSYNLGVRGQTGAEIAARAHLEVSERLACKGDRQAVVVAFGTNDIRLDRPVEETAAALERIIRWTAGVGYPVFVVGAPHAAEPELDALRALYNVNMEETARRLDAPYLDIRERVADWTAWHRGAMEGDGVHPGSEGYAAVAAAFGAWLPWRRWLDG
ncbi:MAG TPA: GDSL-type esterase/lipase family protein [Caulobacteraceae bacterium]|jgi:lysophospholipase L1-like esterase